MLYIRRGNSPKPREPQEVPLESVYEDETAEATTICWVHGGVCKPVRSRSVVSIQGIMHWVVAAIWTTIELPTRAMETRSIRSDRLLCTTLERLDPEDRAL